MSISKFIRIKLI